MEIKLRLGVCIFHTSENLSYFDGSINRGGRGIFYKYMHFQTSSSYFNKIQSSNSICQRVWAVILISIDFQGVRFLCLTLHEAVYSEFWLLCSVILELPCTIKFYLRSMNKHHRTRVVRWCVRLTNFGARILYWVQYVHSDNCTINYHTIEQITININEK